MTWVRNDFLFCYIYGGGLYGSLDGKEEHRFDRFNFLFGKSNVLGFRSHPFIHPSELGTK